MVLQAAARGSAKKIIYDVRVRVPKIRERVAISAANKASTKVGTQFRRQLSATTGVKQKEFKTQTKQFRANLRRQVARTWFGTRRGIRLAVLSKNPTAQFDPLARFTLHGKSGADSFRGTVKTGNKGVASTTSEGLFVRKGAARLPISQVRVKFDSVAEPLMAKVGRTIGPPAFKKEFNRDLARRLKRR